MTTNPSNESFYHHIPKVVDFESNTNDTDLGWHRSHKRDVGAGHPFHRSEMRHNLKKLVHHNNQDLFKGVTGLPLIYRTKKYEH